MKFTHRIAGPRKGNGASPVGKVKRKFDSILCSRCGEHRSKCGCSSSSRKPLATLGDADDWMKAIREARRYEVGQCIQVQMTGSMLRMTGSITVYNATVTEISEDQWPTRVVTDHGWVLKQDNFVVRES